jgi:hypothetical protein
MTTTYLTLIRTSGNFKLTLKTTATIQLVNLLAGIGRLSSLFVGSDYFPELLYSWHAFDDSFQIFQYKFLGQSQIKGEFPYRRCPLILLQDIIQKEQIFLAQPRRGIIQNHIYNFTNPLELFFAEFVRTVLMIPEIRDLDQLHNTNIVGVSIRALFHKQRMVHLYFRRDLALPPYNTELNKIPHLPADPSLIEEQRKCANKIIFVIKTGD